MKTDEKSIDDDIIIVGGSSGNGKSYVHDNPAILKALIEKWSKE